MRKSVALIILVLLSFKINAQQYSLYNTRTLFDSFENPSQKTFVPDSSRRFALSFFPTFGINAAMGGPASKNVFKSLIFDDEVNSTGLSIGKGESSRFFAHMNTYLLMFKVYTSLRNNEEMGVSWQVRSDNQATISNETIVVFDDYNQFTQTQNADIFNNKGYSQNYHQLSFAYRKDYSKELGLGLKVSYLSGIAYNHLKIDESTISIDNDADYYDLYIKGKFRTNFRYGDSISTSFVMPGFKNPGASFSASMNYKLPRGWYVLANLKDIGFIKWSEKSYLYSLDRNIAINNASDPHADDRLIDELDFHTNYKQTGFTTMINGKAEVLINKNYNHYQPSLLLSKNLFYPGGDIALLHNFNLNNLNLGFSTTYNTSKILQVGTQFMLKSPNAEFFIGSDQLYKTIREAKALGRDDKSLWKGYPGASFYMGFSVKFGYIIEHPQNARRIPDFNTGMGFFERMLRRIGIRL